MSFLLSIDGHMGCESYEFGHAVEVFSSVLCLGQLAGVLRLSAGFPLHWSFLLHVCMHGPYFFSVGFVCFAGGFTSVFWSQSVDS